MRTIGMMALALACAGCGQADQDGTVSTASYDLAPLPPEQGMQAPPGLVAEPARAPTTTAQIAYTYGVRYTLADGQVAPIQARHVALCTSLGPARCRIGSTQVTGGSGPGSAATGNATFFIEAARARAFLARLDQIAAAGGGTATDRQTNAEDLTKQIVDTDARVRAKQALADRLVVIIRTSTGNVGQLVEAERAYADAQEELDSARQLSATLRGRVAMSEVTVTYSSTTATGTLAPVTASFASAGATLAGSIAAVITFLVVALPWALLLALFVWIARRRGWQVTWPRRWRRESTPD